MQSSFRRCQRDSITNGSLTSSLNPLGRLLQRRHARNLERTDVRVRVTVREHALQRSRRATRKLAKSRSSHATTARALQREHDFSLSTFNRERVHTHTYSNTTRVDSVSSHKEAPPR